MKTALKKFIPLTLILVALLGFSACRDRASSPEESSQNDQETYEGVIEKASLSAYTEGTHRIITDDGAHLIQSSTINLSRYEGKEVEVSGVLKKGRSNSEPVLNVEKIRLTQVSFDSPFTEYESERYDFTLEHPETWDVGVSDLGVVLTFNDEPWVNINVYNNQSHLETFVPTHEDEQGVEVTVAHQRAIRFNDTDSFRVYVEHPPTERIYRIRFDQEHFSDPEKQPLFYELLNSFEFVYNPTVEGSPCGGPENLQCEEDYRCEVKNGRSDAVGVCVPLTGAPSAGACPYIAPPTGCAEYRVEEYNDNGCPFRYECLEEGLSVFESIELKPAPEPEEGEDSDSGEDADEQSEPAADQDQDSEDADSDEEAGETKDYTVPSAESVTGEYTTRTGVSIKYPKSWYFQNFGAPGIGFAPQALESIDDAVMILKEGSGGDLTKQVDGKTYSISGPSDLRAVMQAILDSIEIE